MAHKTIPDYHAAQTADDAALCDRLHAVISAELPEADARMWHAHPVWFLADNPIVGYSKLKDCVRLMFWSGQSFATPGLTPTGTFKAAEIRYRGVDDVDLDVLTPALAEARQVQWDYANIVRRKGKLLPLCGLDYA